MILKHFLMGFGGVATVTGVGIGVYYGTNSSENARKEVKALALTNPKNEKPNSEDTQNNLESENNNDQLQPSKK